MLRQNSGLRECGTAFVVFLLLFIWEMIIYGNIKLFLFSPNFHTALVLLNQSLTSPFFYFYIPRHSRPSGIVDFYSYFTTLPVFLLSFTFSATKTEKLQTSDPAIRSILTSMTSYIWSLSTSTELPHFILISFVQIKIICIALRIYYYNNVTYILKAHKKYFLFLTLILILRSLWSKFTCKIIKYIF